jgi:hypothetical protein
MNAITTLTQGDPGGPGIAELGGSAVRGRGNEELDMIDLQAAIDATDNPDIQQLYENLMSGSRNHLRAYVGHIENLGIVYEAQYLTQEEVDEIVDSAVERGTWRN